MKTIKLPMFAIRGLNTVRRNAPEILTGVGVVGTVGTVVLASKATLKAPEVLDTLRQGISDIKEVREHQANGAELDYSDTDYKRDLTFVYARAAIDFTKLYGPAFILGAASLGCLIGSTRILRGRNIALAAAYKALDTDFGKYRDRVVQTFGEEAEAQLREMKFKETGTTTNEDGEEVKTYEVDSDSVSEYARFFDEGSERWSNAPSQNLMFLRHNEQYFNDILKLRGHVFLNEVYDALGVPRTPAGAVCGWVWDTDSGDGYVDFGVYDRGTGEVSARRRDFVNGYEKSILLDFNVDGVIYDLI